MLSTAVDLRFVLPSAQGWELTHQQEELILGCVRFRVVNIGSQVLGDKHSQEERGKEREKERLVKGERKEEGRRGGGK